jgi:hypothetical protein
VRGRVVLVIEGRAFGDWIVDRNLDHG